MNHRFLKFTGGLLVVLALAYAAASWYAGRLAQQIITAWVDQTNQNMAAQWSARTQPPTLKIRSYDRGLFSSKIAYALDYQDAQGHAHELGLQDAMRHGPWPWNALRTGDWRPLAAYSRMTPDSGGDWKPWADALPPGTSPWVARSRIGFAGDVATDVQFAPIKTDTVEFGGGSLQVSYDPKLRQMQVSGHFETLALTEPAVQATLRLSGLKLQARSVRSGDSDYQSHQDLRLDGLELAADDSSPIILKQQTLTVDAAQTGSLMDSQAKFEARHLLLGTHDVGALQAAASIQNLSTPALQGLARTLAAVRASHPDGQDLSAAEQQQIRTSLLPVLAASPRIALQQLQWVNAQGTTGFSAQAEFRPVDDTAPQDLGATVERGIRKVSLHAQLSKPMLLQVLRQTQTGRDADMAVALVSMVFDQYAGRLARAGVVKQTDQGLIQTDLSYADGQITANGVTMTPDEFSQRLTVLQGGLL